MSSSLETATFYTHPQSQFLTVVTFKIDIFAMEIKKCFASKYCFLFTFVWQGKVTISEYLIKISSTPP